MSMNIYASYTKYIPINISDKDCPNSNIWGTELWKILHSIFNLENTILLHNSSYIHNFILYSLKLLPCPYCLNKINNLLESIPNNLSELELWVWNLHNFVNDSLNKPGLEFNSINRSKYTNLSLHGSFNIYLHHLYLAVDLKYIDKDKWFVFRNNLIPIIQNLFNI
jgi:hypothetical protein